MNRKGFTAIEACIVVAIVAIILAIVIPALSNSSSKPGSHREYEGWTYVTESPRKARLYMKHLPEKHITVYWNDHNGTMVVVNDRD